MSRSKNSELSSVAPEWLRVLPWFLAVLGAGYLTYRLYETNRKMIARKDSLPTEQDFEIPVIH